MTELFLIALLASGLTVLMWGNVTELAEACRERVKKWALSFKEETGSEGKIKFKAESLPDKTYDHIRMLMRLTLGMGTDRSVKVFLLISLLFSNTYLQPLFQPFNRLFRVAICARNGLF